MADRPPEHPSPRFRISVFDLATGWEAVVYDLHDHGDDLPYAVVSGRVLGPVIQSAAHYVTVAEPAPPFADLVPTKTPEGSRDV